MCVYVWLLEWICFGTWQLVSTWSKMVINWLASYHVPKKQHDHLMTTGRLFVAGARWSNYQFRPAKNQLENTDSSLTWIVVVVHVEQVQ